jgi:pimeloyl-ACP methyl ester carboxylesterase
MWRKVMPALAGHYTVIAPDLRGPGGSDAPAGGYDKATLAEDIRRLLLALGRTDQVSLVGHDIGTMVSYAYAAAHPDSVRRLALLEAPQIDETLYKFPAITVFILSFAVDHGCDLGFPVVDGDLDVAAAVRPGPGLPMRRRDPGRTAAPRWVAAPSLGDMSRIVG